MAQFIFKLEGLLRHRRNVEHEKQRALAIVQAKMTALEAQLRALDVAMQESNNGVRENHLTGRLDLSFLAAHRRYLASTQRRAMDLAQQMGLVQVQIDAARQHLAEAAKDRKALEKLRENQHDAWLLQLKQKEAQEQDETAMQMSYRKSLT